MLTPFDDYLIHQAPLPLAQAGNGHPNFYDRYWFNGYSEDFYFAVALGIYPNRGVIDAAFSVVHKDEQRSVFASGRAPLDRTKTAIGPITIEILEPLRRNRVVVDAPEQGLKAEIEFTARTAAFEEPRQTNYVENRLVYDVTRATQLGSWNGRITTDGEAIELDGRRVYGTKDRSWGVRRVGEPLDAAPLAAVDQFFFLWTPLQFDDSCLHYYVFEDEEGHPWSKAGAVLPILKPGDPVTGAPVKDIEDAQHQLTWVPGLRRAQSAELNFRTGPGGECERVELETLLTFHMRGAGYRHPQWGHGMWHDELVVGGEVHNCSDIDDLSTENIHVQQVVRARWGNRTGLGIMEQLAAGPHRPSGFTGFDDGANS